METVHLEIFEEAINKTVEQGCVSYRAGMCAYRGNDGNKCAVGHLIKDEHYTDELEGKKASHCLIVEALELSLGILLTEADLYYLDGLQYCHDQCKDTKDEEEFKQRFFKGILKEVTRLALPKSVLQFVPEWYQEVETE